MQEFRIKGTNCSIRYNDLEGEDIPIVFIHGLGCAGSFDYVEVVSQAALLSHRRIVVDLLGSGYSDKPTNFHYSVEAHVSYLKEFIDSLGVNRIILFGHSLGGAIAIELAYLCKDKVSHLILSESNLDPSCEGAVSYQIAHFPEENFELSLNQFALESELSGHSMWVSTLKNCLPKAMYEMSQSALKGGAVSWRQLLYQLELPKSYIFGEQSLPDDDFELLKSHGVFVDIVSNAGHSMAWENPKGLAVAIKNCLQSFDEL